MENKESLQEKVNFLEGEIEKLIAHNEILQSTLTRYQLIAENISDIIWVYNVSSHKYSYISPAVKDILGYDYYEILSLKNPVLIPDDLEKTIFDASSERLLQSNNSLERKVFIDEYELFHKNGNKVYVENKSYYITNPLNGHIEIIGIIRDLTEREKHLTEITKEKERAQKNENSYKSLLDNSPDNIIRYDTDYKILVVNSTANESYKKALNIGDGQIIGKTNKELGFPQAEVEIWEQDIQDVIEAKKIVKKIYEYNSHNGNQYFEWRGIPELNKRGEVVSVLCINRDITAQEIARHELMQAKDEIHKSTLKYKKQAHLLDVILKSSLDCIVLLDKDYNFVKVSSTYAKVCQKEISEFVGKNHFEMYPSILKDEFDKYKNEKSIYKRHARPFTFPDHPEWGTTYWDLGLVPILDDENEIEMFIFTLKDVTEEYKTQIALKLAKEKAEESDRLKTAFLNNMSHEIRTPMNAIIGFSEMLKKANRTEEQKTKFIDIITTSGRRLLNIVNDILDISKIEAGLISIAEEKCNISSICHNIVDLYTLSAAKKNIEIISCKNSQCKVPETYADKTKVEQIINNLINNALKFTKKGKVKLSCEIIDNEIQFCIADTGIGIDKNMHNRIFDRFCQTDLTINRNYEGTGLGLAISKGLVEAMNGKIWVESELDKGASFYFTIPFKPVNKSEQIIEVFTKETNDDAMLKTVLIVEDEIFNYLYMVEILSELELNIHHAENGQEAIDFFKKNEKPDLVLMDLKMPIMNGYEAIKEIKAIDSDTPIIAVSAFAFVEDQTKATEAGFNDFISKPVEEEALLALINKYL